MSKEPPPGVLGGLPRTRPHRRSGKRPDSADTVAETKASAAPGPVETQAARSAKPRAAPARATAAKAPESPPAKPRAAKARTTAAKAPESPPAKPRAAKARPPQRKRLSQPDTPTTAERQPRSQPEPPRPEPERADSMGLFGIAIQAAAELAEIGLTASARAWRDALSRLPRP